MTHDEFREIKARHQHNHGGEMCPDCYEEADINSLVAEVERLREAVAVSWSYGFECGMHRPADAEESIKYRDLAHIRQAQAILDGREIPDYDTVKP